MRKRLTLLTGIFPPDIGGPATSVPALVPYLRDAGWDVAIVTLADRPEPSLDDPCPVVRIPRRKPRLRRIDEVRRSVHRLKPDLVFASGLHVESTVAREVPVVQKIVGDWAWERARNLRWTSVGVEQFERARLPARARALRLLRRRVTRTARMVVVPSRFVGKLVSAWGVEERRLRVVPNAAPAAVGFKRHLRSRRALFVGRLVPWKHVDHAIRALAPIPDLELDVLGVGPELESLHGLTRSLAVERRVRFHGLASRDAVRKIMTRAAFLVLPSSYEGMPHVVLEAFAAGLPVVAADAAGTREIVRDHVSGLLYPWGDLHALEDAMQAAMEPEVAARVREGGRAVAARLTMEASAQATCEVLDEAVASS
jgi:glycosyltransferase involved in cell wall biosynthesis